MAVVAVVGSEFKAKVRFMERSERCRRSSTQLMSVNQDAGDGGERTAAEQEGGCWGEGNGFHYATVRCDKSPSSEAAEGAVSGAGLGLDGQCRKGF